MFKFRSNRALLQAFSRCQTAKARCPLSEGFASSAMQRQSRIERINRRLPGWLSRYTVSLARAPISHVSAFLILHELTALVPLLSLATAFHYSNWLPPFISEWRWVSDGVQKFGNYFRRKGWIDGSDDPSQRRSLKDRWWGRGEKGTRIVVEVATAWAITKFLLPVRIPLSVWATPWFARTFIMKPAGRFRSILRRSNSNMAASGSSMKGNSVAAGTGATAGGVIPSNGPK